jgi:hypothetical protein
LTTASPSRYDFAHREPGELPKLRGEGCFRPVFELRRLSTEAALVDSSGARDHHARSAWLRASGRRFVSSHSDQSLKNRSPKRWFATAPLRIAYAALGSYGVDGGERGEILAGDPLDCEPALLP